MLVVGVLAVGGVGETSAQRRTSAPAARPDAVTQNGHSHPIERLVVSPDGKTVATGADGGGFGFEIKLWNVESGRLISTLHFNWGKGLPVLRFGASGNTIAAFDDWQGTIRIWEVRTRRMIYESYETGGGAGWKGFVRRGEFPKSYLESKGESLTSGEGPREVGRVRTMDGKRYATKSGYEVTVWDAATDKPVSRFGTKAKGTGAVAVSPDGRYLAFTVGSANWTDGMNGERLSSGGEKSRALVWDTKADSPRPLAGEYGVLASPKFDPRGEMIAATEYALAGEDADDEEQYIPVVAARFWDTKSGALLFSVEGEKFLFFNSDASRFVSVKSGAKRDDPSTINLRDARGGQLVKSAEGFDPVLTPDAKAFLIWHGQSLAGARFTDEGKKRFEIWDARTGNDLSNDPALLKLDEFAYRETESWSAFEMRELGSGRVKRRVPYPKDISHPYNWVVGPDGKTVATLDLGGSGGWPNSLYNFASGRSVYVGHNFHLPTYDATGKLLALGSAEGRVALYDAHALRRLLSFDSGAGPVGSVAFHPNGYLITSVNGDGSIRLFSRGTGKLVATLIAAGEGDWLVATPEGFFDGSPSAWGRVGWRFADDPLRVMPVEAFFNEFYRPGLLPAIFSGQTPKPAGVISDKDRRQPRINLSMSGAVATPVNEREVKVSVEVSEDASAQHAPTAATSGRGGSGARDVRLFRNGSLVRAWRGDVLEGKPGATLEVTVPIVAGENRFTAYAFNRDNVKSADAEALVVGADSLKRKGTAYILAVGVNKYANPGYNLKYAVADAEEFGAELKRQQEKLSSYERVEVISLHDGEATKQNILRALADLAARVRPEDALTVYFAGHGTAHENRFYLLPHDLGYAGARSALDAAGLQAILAHSVSDRELEEAFERVDAGQLIFVIDACNSGQALEAEEKRRGPMNSEGLAQLAYEKGMYILTAAQSFQAAQEAARLGHGFLTYALVEECLKRGHADDEPKDGTLSAREWFDFATARVPKMQEDLMKDAGTRGLNIAFLDGEERIADPDKRNVQRPRAFYRRELGARHPIVARSTSSPASGGGKAIE
jgi:WD40 repeat protein